MASSGSEANQGKEVTFSGSPNTGSVTEPVINSKQVVVIMTTLTVQNLI